MGAPRILLLDNGSIFAESTRNLRRLAHELAARTGEKVHPVSLLHSSGIDPGELDGEPARIFEPFLQEQRERFGFDDFLVIPLFFGPSAALTEYLPQRIRALRRDWPGLSVRIAPSLVDEGGPGERLMAEMLAGLVRELIAREKLERPAVALVDHGTPREGVNRVRNRLARRLEQLLEGEAARVGPASMERRPEAAFDFNEPLLERLLGREGFDGDVVVSMQFLSPGRHAGPGGDIDRICAAARRAHPGLRTCVTPLVGSHPDLIDLLELRWKEAWK